MFKVHTVTLIFVRFIEILWSFFCGWLHRTKGISTVYPKWPSFNLLAPLYGPTFDTNPSQGFIIPKAWTQQMAYSRDPISNTFSLRFYIRQEGLLVIMLRHLLLDFCYFVAQHFPSVLPIIVDHRPKTSLRVHLKHDCNTIALQRSSTLHSVNVRGSVVSLAGRFWVDISVWEGVTCL